jgi:hypothetical protein
MQPPLWQVWIDLIVKVLGTVATFAAVFVALFGSWLRNKLWPPELRIALSSTEGYASQFFILNDERSGQIRHVTDGLWYFVKVDNTTRWNPVTGVHVFLLSMEEPDAAGQYRVTWFGRAALGWRHEANPQPKQVGYSAEVDLCHVLKQPLQLLLSPIIRGQAPVGFDQPIRMRLTLQASGVEADSNVLRINVSWDGKWSDNKDEMKRHLVVTPA